jgi:hypothetical protein
MTEASRPRLPLTGGCPCGAIRYEVTTLPLSLYACHCTDCQRQSGSSFALNMPVSTAALRITRGVTKGWRHTSPSGAAVVSHFCAECGGRVYGERDGRPESINLRAGTLDDTMWLQPVAHFFTRSAQHWERLSPDDALCFEGMPDATLGGASLEWRAKLSDGAKTASDDRA